jgi:hypothetical protein
MWEAPDEIMEGSTMRRCYQFLLLCVLVAVSISTLIAAELRDTTSQAHAEYVRRAQESFVRRMDEPPGGSDPGAQNCRRRRRWSNRGKATAFSTCLED